MAWGAVLLVAAVSGGFTDDFNDNARGPQWSDYASSTSVAEQNQRLEVRTTANVAGYAGFSTAQRFNLHGGYTQIELVDVGNQTANGWQLTLSVYEERPDGGAFDQLFLTERGGLQVYAGERGLLASVGSLASVRWIRVREEGGSTFWEYSPDRTSWSVLYSEPNQSPLERVMITVGGGTYAALAQARTGALDNFEVYEAPLVSADGGSAGDGGAGGSDAAVLGPAPLSVGCSCAGAGAPGALLWPGLLALGLLRACAATRSGSSRWPAPSSRGRSRSPP